MERANWRMHRLIGAGRKRNGVDFVKVVSFVSVLCCLINYFNYLGQIVLSFVSLTTSLRRQFAKYMPTADGQKI